METRTLIRVAAGAAIAGGLVRAADPILASARLSGAVHQQIWFLIDLMLLIGAAGISLAKPSRLSAVGLTGMLIFALGILLVRSSNVAFFGIGGYSSGAAVALIGIAIFAISQLFRRTQRVAASLWLASLAVGFASNMEIGRAYLTELSGFLFGLGFIAAGTGLVRIAAAVDDRRMP